MGALLPKPDLPAPPAVLAYGAVTLRFDEIVPGIPERGFVPYYHFRILLADGTDVGHINLRVGDTEHVRISAGHIGFAIKPPFRGHGYAGQACRAIIDLVRLVSPTVTITCDPGNVASRKTIEKLGAEWIDEVPVPPHDPHYDRGGRISRRYRWTP
jgi:tagatose 1,6-diphosphate aldolase